MTSKKLLAIGTALGVVVVVLLNLYIAQVRQQERAVAVLQLSPEVTLARGDTLELEHLVVLELPERFGDVLKQAIPATADAREWIRGRPVTQDIEPGELLLFEHFDERIDTQFAGSIQPGMRALSVPVDSATAVSYLLEPDSRVDVLATLVSRERVPTPEDPLGEDRAATRTLLQNVRVLAVGHATSRGGYQKADKRRLGTVTLEVSPLDAETLVFALQNPELRGGLTLSLRNPEDAAEAPIASVNFRALRAESTE